MPDDNGLEALQTYVQSRRPTVVLDTNILIHGSDNKLVHRYLNEACALMDVRICDTVYWEFLRNTNIDKFRSRRHFLSTWLKKDFLKETTILRESKDVVAMHRRLFVLLLYFYPQSPQTVLDYLTPDLWIAAVAVQNLFDHVLTENKSDFPSGLFEPVVQIGTSEAPAYLLRFKREEVREAWLEMIETPAIDLDISSVL